MSRNLKIAIATELDWALARHYGLIGGVQDYAAQLDSDWDVEVCRYPELRMEEGMTFDGIVGRISPECLAAAGHTPIVNTWINSPVVDKMVSVLSDPQEAGRMAARHLVARGFRRFVHFGIRGFKASRLHLEGVLEVTREKDFSCSHYMVHGDFDDTPEHWKRFLKIARGAIASWEPPLAVIVWGDHICRGLVSTCLVENMDIPFELAFVSTGNNELLCSSVKPSLTSVDLNHRKVGFEAAKTLHRMIEKKTIPEQITLIPPLDLVVRRSSDLFAVNDDAVAAAMRFMAENSHRKILVPDIAAEVGLGRQVLERRFLKAVGHTVNKELIRLRVESLKRLLIESEIPVKELCPQVGFGTTVNMFKTFKKLTGMTPSAYRERHLALTYCTQNTKLNA